MDEIEGIRARLQEKPKSAKLMAELAVLLAANQTTHATPEKDYETCRLQHERSMDKKEDGLYWAYRSVDHAPGKPFGYSALSRIHPEFDVRMKSLRQAIELTDKDAYAKAMVGMLYQLLDEPRKEEARQIQAKTGKTNKIRRPFDTKEQDAYQRLCSAFDNFWQKQTPRTSADDIEYVASREYRIGLMLRKLQPEATCRPKARAHLQRVVTKLPKDHQYFSLSQFWLATMDEDSTRGLDRCPKDYVVGLYSTFAQKFDSLLVDKLSYKTPQLMRSLLEKKGCITKSERLQRVIDLGCGTGLSGLAFRDCTLQMEGVDLSPEMIAKARERKCYDRLFVGDVLDIFNRAETEEARHPGKETLSISLVVACDVFCYIGDLLSIFERVHAELPSGGIFAFSNELLCSITSKEAQPYKLHGCARFAHRQSYIEELAKTANFAVVAIEASVIRKNQGEDVQGLLTVLRKVEGEDTM